jgi:hypothetical protein
LAKFAGPILKPTAVLKGIDAGQVMERPVAVWVKTRVAVLPKRDTDWMGPERAVWFVPSEVMVILAPAAGTFRQ